MKVWSFQKSWQLCWMYPRVTIFYLEVSSLNYKPVKVMHIAENYYYHYVYMTPECYQSLILGKILSMMKYLS